ncbi:24695_t:CDS:2, partial [Gigaspora margarita]
LFQEYNLTWKQIKYKHKTLIEKKICKYFNTISSHIRSHQSNFIQNRVNNSNSILSFPLFKINIQLQHNVEVPKNAVSQHDTIEKIEVANKKISEYERINTVEKKLKHHTEAQARLEAKKTKLLQESIVEKYDGPERPLAAMNYSDFWDKIHKCVEYGAAHAKKRKVTIKPHYSCASTTCRHHHPTKVALASIARTNMKPHANKHYCLALVKATWIFAKIFANNAIIISQDNKVKIGLGVPAVGRTFKSIQTINEPVSVANHDFLIGRQLAIFIRPEYSLAPHHQPILLIFRVSSPTSKYRAPDAALLLDQIDGFLPPIIKAKDQYFINPIHALQYYDKIKILPYDCCCLSISQELHQRLYCNKCDKYFPTLKYMTNYKRTRHSSGRGCPSQQVAIFNEADDM